MSRIFIYLQQVHLYKYLWAYFCMCYIFVKRILGKPQTRRLSMFFFVFFRSSRQRVRSLFCVSNQIYWCACAKRVVAELREGRGVERANKHVLNERCAPVLGGFLKK